VGTSCVHVFTLLDAFRVRENFLRARLHLLGRVSRSREHLACTFSLYWPGFAFARTSCVHLSPLLAGFRVRENISRARFHSIGRVSRSRELLACIFPPFRADFAFARTSRVHTYTLLGGFCVRENFSRACFHSFGRVSRSRELLACIFPPFWAGFAFARTSHLHFYTLLDEFRVCKNFLRIRFPPFWRVSSTREFLSCMSSLFLVYSGTQLIPSYSF
jgi:hypothetical protein